MTDTIVAISTPPGQSGIGLVRLSGHQAISIVASVFFSPKGVDLFKMPSHKLTYGFIRQEDGDNIDEVLVTVMRRPSTYTREDIVEINAHGGIVPLRETLRLLIRQGARLAQPGEFTKRAFLNGRLDLAQTEAVADFIRAKTINQARIAMRQLKGGLSQEISKIRDDILDILAELEAAIDFPEEVLEINSNQVRLAKLKEVSSRIEKLLSQAGRGRLLTEGARVVIAGRPNVGKSSLLNTLLSRERAIVTPFPGTTRDTIEEEIEIDGYLVKLIDTAGWREPLDPIEREGIKRTEESVRESDLVIFLLDGGEGVTTKDRELFSSLNGQKIIVAINKIDLPLKLREGELGHLFPDKPVVKISATQKINIEGLLKLIRDFLEGEPLESEIITALRHEEILKSVAGSIREAITALEKSRGEEFISLELREGLSKLGEITGEVYTEDILDKIFSRFCIGK